MSRKGFHQGDCKKVAYKSKNEAKEAHLFARFRYRIYWCRTCTAWHVTNHDKLKKGTWRMGRPGRWNDENYGEGPTKNVGGKKKRRRKKWRTGLEDAERFRAPKPKKREEADR